MKTKWRDILKDKTQFPDDFKVDMGNGNVMSLGDLRADDVESHGAVSATLTAREQELNTRAETLRKADSAVQNMFAKYLEVTGLSAEEALAGKTPTKREISASADLDEKDPILGKFVSALNEIKNKVGAMETNFQTTQKNVLAPMLSTYLDDYYQDRFNDKIAPKLPKSAKDKIKFEDVMKHAETQGYKDARGRLDLDKATRDLTYDFRVEEAAEERAQERVKKLREEETMGAMGKPGATGNNPRTRVTQDFKNPKTGRTISLEEAMSKAYQDASIWTGAPAWAN